MLVHEYPSDMDQWTERHKWVIAGLCDTSKRSREQLKEFLELCNSDSTKDHIIHFCRGCCASEEEAMDKVLRVAVPFFSRGFPVPLLHRFKHYATASSYIKTSACCFSLLPQVLAQMQVNSENQSDASSRLSGMVDSLLQDDGSKPGDETEGFQRRLDELLDGDLSYSLQNSIRRRLVMREVSKPDFCQNAMLIDSIVGCMEYGTNLFLQRTSKLTQMVSLGSQHPQHDRLCQSSRESFLHIVSGGLGVQLINSTISLLGTGLANHVRMGFEPTAERLQLFFRLVIACASDIWRRMVLEFTCSYPFRIFEWLSDGFSTDDFAKSWDNMLQSLSLCQGCVDDTFSRVIAAEHPEPLSSASLEEKQALFDEMRRLLWQIATYAPTNSDTVEVKHGNMQWVVAKRGSMYVKKQKAAKESSVLQSVIRPYGLVYEDAYKSTMPSRSTRAGVRRRVGHSGKNQHSKQDRARDRVFEHLSLKFHTLINLNFVYRSLA